MLDQSVVFQCFVMLYSRLSLSLYHVVVISLPGRLRRETESHKKDFFRDDIDSDPLNIY